MPTACIGQPGKVKKNILNLFLPATLCLFLGKYIYIELYD